jgi:AbrB family looped-hinge helix DNA binding protein
MPEKGQILVPKKIRDEHGFGNGSAFAVFKTKSGAIVFRPIKAFPGKDLVEHLLQLGGLIIEERKHNCPPHAGAAQHSKTKWSHTGEGVTPKGTA